MEECGFYDSPELHSGRRFGSGIWAFARSVTNSIFLVLIVDVFGAV